MTADAFIDLEKIVVCSRGNIGEVADRSGLCNRDTGIPDPGFGVDWVDHRGDRVDSRAG